MSKTNCISIPVTKPCMYNVSELGNPCELAID
jgi:hypothetical protein